MPSGPGETAAEPAHVGGGGTRPRPLGLSPAFSGEPPPCPSSLRDMISPPQTKRQVARGARSSWRGRGEGPPSSRSCWQGPPCFLRAGSPWVWLVLARGSAPSGPTGPNSSACPKQPPGWDPAGRGPRARRQAPPTAAASPPSPSKQPISALQPPTSLQPACGTPGKKESVLPQGSGVRGTPPCHAPHWPPPIPSQGGRLGPGALTSTPTNSPPHSSDTRLTPSPQARPPSNLVGEGAGNQARVFPM